MNGWPVVPLKSLGTIERGKSRHRPRYDPILYNGKYPFIQTGDVKAAGRYINSFEQTYNDVGLAQSRLWPKGTLCITIAANIAEVSILEIDACFPDSVVGFTPFDPKCDVKFVYYFLNNYKQEIQKLAYGTVQDNINLKTFEEVKVPLPSIDEQQRIVDILGSLDEKIELNRRMNETLEQMAMALYKHWFGEGEEEQKLSDLIDINPSVKIKKDTPMAFVDMKGLPVDSMSVSDEDIIIKLFSSGSKFVKNDVLFARITPCLENGKTAFVDFLDDGQVGFGSTEFLVFRAKENCCPQFVYCLSRDPEFRAYAIKSMVGTSGRQRVQTSSISEYLVAKPDPDLMERFDGITKDWFSQIRSNTQEISELRKTRDYLLPRLLSGEIEVKAAEEQVEEVLAGV